MEGSGQEGVARAPQLGQVGRSPAVSGCLSPMRAAPMSLSLWALRADHARCWEPKAEAAWRELGTQSTETNQ